MDNLARLSLLFWLLFWLIFLLITPSLAFAEASGPDFWQLRDVRKGNVLNMRSHADINASIVGKIPAGADCIRNMGCSGGLSYQEFTTLSEAEKQKILKQRPRWCRVSYKGVTAWAAGAYLREGSCPDDSEHRADPSANSLDPFNHIYAIEGEEVVLHNGDAGKTIPDSSALIITKIIYTPVYGKLKRGGDIGGSIGGDIGGKTEVPVAATILAQQTGGSGTFYYLAVAIEGGEAIESYFLGDRIHVRFLKIESGRIIVDYLERAEGQAMAVKPSVKVRKQFVLEDGKLTSE